MDASNLDVTVEPHTDGGFCLGVHVFPRTGEKEVREMQGYLVNSSGAWQDEGEAKAARDELRRRWRGV